MAAGAFPARACPPRFSCPPALSTPRCWPRSVVRKRRVELEGAEIRRTAGKAVVTLGSAMPRSTAADPAFSLKSKSSAL